MAPSSFPAQLCEGCSPVFEELLEADGMGRRPSLMWPSRKKRDWLASNCPFCSNESTNIWRYGSTSSHFKIRRKTDDKAIIIDLQDENNTPLEVNHVAENKMLSFGRVENASTPKPMSLSVLPIRKIPTKIDWSLVRNALGTCSDQHSQCSREDAQSSLNLMLIDCHDPNALRLHMFPSHSCQYIALSYVWGKSTAETERIKESGLPEILPRTLQDAVEVVRLLGFRYLWIDRYCVPQGNEDEKHLAIQSMDKIYGNAALTVVVAAGHDLECGIPGIGATEFKLEFRSSFWINLRYADQIYQMSPNTEASYSISVVDPKEFKPVTKGVYFQCMEMYWYHNFLPHVIKAQEIAKHEIRMIKHPDELIPQVFPPGNIGDSPFEISRRISEYLSRDITFDTDCIFAFQGILEKFAQLPSPVTNIYGIPVFSPDFFHPRRWSLKERLLYGLCWSLRGGCVRRRDFPSWTWAGLKRRRDEIINFRLELESDVMPKYTKPKASAYPCFVVSSVQFQCANASLRDSLRGLIGGEVVIPEDVGLGNPLKYLWLLGWVFDLHVIWPPQLPTIQINWAQDDTRTSRPELTVWKKAIEIETADDERNSPDKRYLGLILAFEEYDALVCLLLSTDAKAQVYERVGILHVDGSGSSFFKESSPRSSKNGSYTFKALPWLRKQWVKIG